MISLEQVSYRVGTFSLSNVSLSVQEGEYAVLMGKTGCGKTKLLETMCGLIACTSGRIVLMDRDVTHMRPGERGVGYVPQDQALFPAMTVREHLAFAPMLRKWPRKEIDARVAELAALLGLTHLLTRKPHGLSGGEAQRVALGRALASRPPILCLDEPLSALDQSTRAEMCDYLKAVRRHSNVTTLHVTHDKHEAAELADNIFFLEEGIIKNISANP